MDDLQFDRWTRTVSDRRSRRGLGRLGAGALAAFGAGIATTVEAKKKKRKKKKKQPKPRCPAGEDFCLVAQPQPCGGGQECYCATGSGPTICGDFDGADCSETADLCDVDADCATVTGPGVLPVPCSRSSVRATLAGRRASRAACRRAESRGSSQIAPPAPRARHGQGPAQDGLSDG